MSYRVPLSRPSVGTLEHEYVRSALSSGQLALGPWLDRFEQAVARQCGARHAVAVSSGTAALHIMVKGLGLKEGDEVITTPYSFIASANCLLYERCTPKFVDIDPITYNIDPQRAADSVSQETRGILAVDLFGCPADWPSLTEIASRRDLILLDDGCESLGAVIDGRPVGNWADGCALGFYPNKQITTGEGGCITTDDAAFAGLARSLRNQGRTSDAHMEHTELGFNYRLDEMSAALGCAQLERFETLEAGRRRAAGLYDEFLSEYAADVLTPARPPGIVRSWFVYVIRLADDFEAGARDRLRKLLSEQGIQTAPYFPAIHLQPLYRDRFGLKQGDFPVAEATAERTLALPFFADISEEEIASVCSVVARALSSLPRTSISVSIEQ